MQLTNYYSIREIELPLPFDDIRGGLLFPDNRYIIYLLGIPA